VKHHDQEGSKCATDFVALFFDGAVAGRRGLAIFISASHFEAERSLGLKIIACTRMAASRIPKKACLRLSVFAHGPFMIWVV
jgi:hypothetical protein